MSQTVNTTTQQTAPKKLVEVKDLEISFGEGKKRFVAVKNANFFINKGETFSLVNQAVVKLPLGVPLSDLITLQVVRLSMMVKSLVINLKMQS